MITVRTIDAHVSGAPLRLIVDGFPAPRGATISEKQRWASRRADHIRRIVMCEPRGHIDMCGAVLTESVHPGSDAGLLFLHNEGFAPLIGHAIVAVTTIALERRLLMPRGNDERIAFDTVAGTVRATVTRDTRETDRIERVSYANVPSFVLHPGVDVLLTGRRLRADIAFGGEFYAIVDAESAGLAIDGAHLEGMRRLGVAIADAVNRSMDVVHPVDPALAGVAGTIFTAPPVGAGADLRCACVFAAGAIDRSPSGNGTAAVMAVLDAMGLLADSGRFAPESIIGTMLEGRIAGRTRVGAVDAIVPDITGSAYITGDHTWVVDERDPLREGFRIS